MKIMDCFCGIGPWMLRDPLLPYKPEDILALLDHFGIETALVHSNFVSGNGSTLRGNRLIREACAGQPRFLPMYSMTAFPHEESPRAKDYLADMREMGSRAAWLSAGSRCVYPWLYADILTACSRQKVPVFLHRELVDPADIDLLMREFPALRLVLVGLSYGDDWWLYPLLERHRSLHVCLGHLYVPSNNPMRFLRHFPAERMLFGSGLPHFSPGGLITHLTYAEIGDGDREKIVRGNLERLLGEAQP